MDTRYDITVLGSVPSTQDEAATRHAATGRAALVITGHQTGGRGRSGRTWLQADRGVAASLAFRPGWPDESWSLIPLTTAVAVGAAVFDRFGIAVEAKWPNDLLVDGAKVAGILAEASAPSVTVGCGINLFWKHPPAGAAGLLPADPGEEPIVPLAVAWATALLDTLERPPQLWPREEYLAASMTVGAAVRWEHGTGTALTVDETGGLVVDTGSERVTLRSGEVHLLR